MGAGHGGFATAAHLTLLGHEVNIYSSPKFAKELLPLIKKREIKIRGKIKRVVKIKGKITSNIEEALEGTKVVIFVLPAFAQKAVFLEALPFLKTNQIVVLTPGNYGSLELSKISKEKKIIFVETQSLPYAARKFNNTVKISGIKRRLLAASFPGKYTKKIIKFLKKNIFPQLVPARNVLEVSLNNPNPILHPIISLFNLTKIEKTKGNFKFYSEGVTRSVAGIIQEVDKERLLTINSLNLRGIPMLKIGFQFYGLKTDSLFNLLTKSPIHRNSKGPESLEHRYITEDVPFGLVPISSIAKINGIETPLIDSFIHIASFLNKVNYWKEGRNLERLGLIGMDNKRLNDYLEKGY